MIMKLEDLSFVIADDEPFLLKINHDILKRQFPSAAIETVTNGRNLVNTVESFKPKLIITDYEMPELDGANAIKEIREKGIATPAIITTGKIWKLPEEGWTYIDHILVPGAYTMTNLTNTHAMAKPYFPQALYNLIQDTLSLPRQG